MQDNYLAEFRDILQLSHRYHRLYKDEQNICVPLLEELSVMQKHVIHYILKNDQRDIYQKDIEKEFLISRATASTMLKTLEKKGIIERIADKKDARLKRLVITSECRKQFMPVYRQMKEIFNNLHKHMCQGIDEKDLQVFDRVLRQMQDNLSREEKHD